MGDGKLVEGSIYFYAPDKGAPVFFTIAFAASGCYHLWQCIYYKAWKVTSLHPITCLLLVVGFALREYGAFNYDNLSVYIASTTFIYMSPPIVELANFHALGRILYYVPYFSPIHPGRTLTTFGTLSAVVEVLNGVGIAWIANPAIKESLRDIGHILIKASLIIQITIISLFALLVGVFHRRCAERPDHIRRVRPPILTMYLSTALILIRCIYRTVEHFTVSDIQPTSDPMSISAILRYEWFFYIFEAVPMLANSFLWNVRHLRRWLPESYHVYLAQDGVTELEGPGWTDNRGFVATALDPFGLCGTEHPEKKPFWETNGYAADGAYRKSGGEANGVV